MGRQLPLTIFKKRILSRGQFSGLITATRVPPGADGTLVRPLGTGQRILGPKIEKI